MVMGDDRGSMEQAQEQWLWVMKRREINIMKGNYSMFDGTWEEKAFTEDYKGIINIWPPRCYSCSFCKREFKSAQALGGHMNVHRRDRARLKQSINHHHHNHHQSSVKSSSSSDHQNHDHHDFSSCPNSTNIVASRVSVLWSSSSGSVGKRASWVSDHDHDHNHFETSLSVGLNQDPATGFRKRSKITTASAVSTPQPVARGGCFMPSSSSPSNDKYGFIRASSTIKENLDLELRLGDPPKVKVQTLP